MRVVREASSDRRRLSPCCLSAGVPNKRQKAPCQRPYRSKKYGDRVVESAGPPAVPNTRRLSYRYVHRVEHAATHEKTTE